jgi:hypothetical protein
LEIAWSSGCCLRRWFDWNWAELSSEYNGSEYVGEGEDSGDADGRFGGDDGVGAGGRVKLMIILRFVALAAGKDHAVRRNYETRGA